MKLAISLTYIILSVVHRLYTNKKVTCTCMMYMYAPNFPTKKKDKKLVPCKCHVLHFFRTGNSIRNILF